MGAQADNAVLTAEVKTKKELERKLIQSLAGCYRVSFQFAETFAAKSDYEYHDRKFAGAKEVAFILEDTEDKISIQHVLYVGRGQVIKHWRQDWIYENREILSLVQNHDWKKVLLTEEQARGTWSQKVYQVDDAPRYEGYGTWVHVDGRHFWESTTDAPLPRREISKRQDYNVLTRHSHIEIFDNGDWVIDQDNKKIIRSAEGEDTLLCMEKGIETFTTKEYDSADAMEWWNGQASFWADVRNIWAEVRADRDRINVTEDEKLYFAQFDLAEQFSGDNYDAEKSQEAIKTLLAKHVEGYQA